MKLVQANAKWLAALACGLMVAGAAMVVGEVGHSKEHVRRQATCVHFPKSSATWRSVPVPRS